jgi:Phage integrase, N-terminal SAM-like domain
MGVKIRQKDGKWYVFINHQGKRKAKCVGDSKRAAEEVKRKLEAKLTLGEFALLDDTRKVPTFGDYAAQWLEHYVGVACKPSTQRVVRGIVRNHLLPDFGTHDLRNITRTQVKAFLLHKHQRYSRKYVRELGRTLHTILAHAVEEELLDRNPAARLGKYLPVQRVAPEQGINPFTSEELAQYLATMHTHTIPNTLSIFSAWRGRACEKGRRSGSSGTTSSAGKTNAIPIGVFMCNGPMTPRTGSLIRRRTVGVDVSICLKNSERACLICATVDLMRPYCGDQPTYPRSYSVDGGANHSPPPGSILFTDACVNTRGFGRTGFMTCVTAMPRSSCTSTTPRSSMCRSSSATPASRLRLTHTVIHGKVPILRWQIALTILEGMWHYMQLLRNIPQ